MGLFQCVQVDHFKNEWCEMWFRGLVNYDNSVLIINKQTTLGYH